MRSLLKKNNETCRRTQDSLEEIAGLRLNARNVDGLLADLPEQERAHARLCSVCGEAAKDLLSTRELFRDFSGANAVDRPFFPARVMAAIAAREKELANLISPWNEVPRFAARLAWITALVLLAGTTWFYEKGIATNHTTNGDPNQESIFETPPPSSPDDVLISREIRP